MVPRCITEMHTFYSQPIKYKSCNFILQLLKMLKLWGIFAKICFYTYSVVFKMIQCGIWLKYEVECVICNLGNHYYMSVWPVWEQTVKPCGAVLLSMAVVFLMINVFNGCYDSWFLILVQLLILQTFAKLELAGSDLHKSSSQGQKNVVLITPGCLPILNIKVTNEMSRIDTFTASVTDNIIWGIKAASKHKNEILSTEVMLALKVLKNPVSIETEIRKIHLIITN